MALWQNIPFFCILLPLGSAAMTSVLKPKLARRWTLLVLCLLVVLSGALTGIMSRYGQSYTFMMGHFPAPWGNEIRAGLLEALTALMFNIIMLLSLMGGLKKVDDHIAHDKQSLYYVMLLLLTAALMAQVYTNDIFTAYVFLEIMTISACALIAARTKGRTLVAATRYMIMNLLGSGLFLLGIILLYDLTGHLLMSNIKEAVAQLHATGEYQMPLTVVVALISIGLSIKSALFPFHTWVPDAYGYTTPTSSAVLSSLVSKGYIFLLIKIYVRVIGFDVICSMGILDVLFVFGVAGMIMGSVSAVRAKTTRIMVAYSSVAQIGYIFAALGLRSQIGIICALWHMAAHAATKSMLFLATAEMDDACGGTHLRSSLRGAFYRAPLLALAFSLGALNLTGVPLLSVFMTKVTLTQAAIDVGGRHMGIILAAVAISTLLNAAYFLSTAVELFIPTKEGDVVLPPTVKKNKYTAVSMVCLIVMNLLLGIFSQPILSVLAEGLTRFA